MAAMRSAGCGDPQRPNPAQRVRRRVVGVSGARPGALPQATRTGQRSGGVSLALEHLAATVEAGRADVVTQVHPAGRRLDGRAGRARHCANGACRAWRRLLVLLNGHEDSPGDQFCGACRRNSERFCAYTGDLTARKPKRPPTAEKPAIVAARLFLPSSLKTVQSLPGEASAPGPRRFSGWVRRRQARCWRPPKAAGRPRGAAR